MSYCVPAVCTDGSVAVGYSQTHEARTPAQLVAGSATVGYRNGERFMHCHAAWLDAAGELRAGHLWPETTLGGVPVYAVVHPLPGISTISTQDPETCMPAFTPHAALTGSVPVGGRRRVAMSRVLPGEDIGAVVLGVCAEQGFHTAEVRAGWAAWSGPACAAVREVDGPATELVTIAGRVQVHDDPADVQLSALVVDRHGEVHAGILEPGRNPVAVTFELLVLEGES